MEVDSVILSHPVKTFKEGIKNLKYHKTSYLDLLNGFKVSKNFNLLIKVKSVGLNYPE